MSKFNPIRVNRASAKLDNVAKFALHALMFKALLWRRVKSSRKETIVTVSFSNQNDADDFHKLVRRVKRKSNG